MINKLQSCPVKGCGRYDLINNLMGWGVFLVALVTYWLTLEPTASYWDCGEFIIQADKLEVGHPPGNPIFMLTARFFANFASSPQSISLMVNAMSGLLSALTILLLFWTITHLVKRLIIRDGSTSAPSLRQYLAIMGSGLVGSLAYTWSDTFWFSAVEGEVYAFSSFCTALVFWLILKWENRADEPHSDRYLILIAYIIGISVAVHLLNLLCIPAIVLVYAYRKFKDMNVLKSIYALLVSFAIIVLVLYGLVPGFIKEAQWFELLFVNSFGMGFNSGVLAYTLLTVGIFLWAIYELYAARSPQMIRLSFFLAVGISGMLFIGSGIWIGIVLLIALAATLWYVFRRDLPVRILNVVMWSIFVIFIGYSSYALILIRSTADTPMNQNSPDNVFALASYLNREQYGDTPLLYGETFNSSAQMEYRGSRVDTLGQYADGSLATISTPMYQSIVNSGKPEYVKGVEGATARSSAGFLTVEEQAENTRLAQRGGDYYVTKDHKGEMKMNPELNMIFPRLYSRDHKQLYQHWTNLDTLDMTRVTLHAYDPATGEEIPELDTQNGPDVNEMTGSVFYHEKTAWKPSFRQNLDYFLNYQLNHMYFRYFMWNFAGRQNDINNQFGELDAGNWISGIPVIDNQRLGDQSLLPDDLGKNNKGHNVYFMLPLLLGIIGLLWQAFAGKRGIEQFWVVFFLFFMTGIAIVLYLNQTPNQPRERDYAFAGSFYAYAIWIGMGVAGLWRILLWFCSKKRTEAKASANNAGEEIQLESLIEETDDYKTGNDTAKAERARKSLLCVATACVIGLIVPLQMVSQTWDDHDRSGRYAARDFAINYLNSLEPNAIIFCNGDNDTFPLWYAQEVEGVRPDVRIINLSYLNSDWYANQMLMQAYESAPVNITATPKDYSYGLLDVSIIGFDNTPADLLQSLRLIYNGNGRDKYGYPAFESGSVYIPVDKKAVIARGLVAPQDSDKIVDRIEIDLRSTTSYNRKNYISLGELLMLDIIATNAANGWPRPIYWASSVGNEYHLGLTPYLRSTGMAHQIVPTVQQAIDPRTDRAYDVIMKKYLWGGADKATKESSPYYDETAGRMLTAVRYSMVDLANQLLFEGDQALASGNQDKAKSLYKQSEAVLQKMEKNLPQYARPYSLNDGMTTAQIFGELSDGSRLGNPDLRKRSLEILENLMLRYAQNIRYVTSTRISHPNSNYTTESTYAPYQYYDLIDLYERFGGDWHKLASRPEMRGIDKEQLRSTRDAFLNGSQGGSAAEGPGTMEELLSEMEKYAEIVNHLSSLSAEEYALTSETERQIDSVFYEVMQQFYSMGGKPEDLAGYPQLQNVDMNRSKRLCDTFMELHPEALEGY